MSDNQTILVTGATGYIGGRLVPRLLNNGYRVRAMARSMDKIMGRPWTDHPNLECVQSNLLDKRTLKQAVSGCHTAYYLVHSMSPESSHFAETDRKAAETFIKVSEESSLKRIIYLGGLGWDQPNASRHLLSRFEVGEILKSGSVPVTILRSAHILGSGSASFEMLRYTAERLPFYVIPEVIINTEIQPICIRNVLNYLTGCLEKEETTGHDYDIGGPEVMSYRQLFETYAEQAGLRLPVFINPHLPPFKFGTWLGLALAKRILPISASISQPLLEGLPVQTVTQENRIRNIIPQNLIRICSAIDRAIQKDSLRIVETRWTDAGELSPPEWMQRGDAPYAGGTLLQGGYRLIMDCTPSEIWEVVSRLGGYNGWYYGDILWQIRGWMDQMVGGVGLRRGRRHPDKLAIGDALDFWRVLDVKPSESLMLLAEMKLPG